MSRNLGRSPARSPSPIPDFGNKNIRWSGWDKPLPRYGASAAPVAPAPYIPQGNFVSPPADAGRLMNASGVPRQLKRLYVGNLPPTLREEHFIDFLNSAMKKVPGVVLGEGNPIIGIDMSSERSYCFIELRSADEATYFTAFDGLTYEGHSLRVHRPREYAPTGNEPPLPEIPPSLLGIVSTTVPDGPNKIFIGGLPTRFNEAEVKDILSAFGPLKAFNLVRDANGASRGFAFCEYVDPSVTDAVCQSFNGRTYGNRTLVVQRSQPGQKLPDFGGSTNGGAQPGPKNDGNAMGIPASNTGTSKPPTVVTNSEGLSILDPEENADAESLIANLLNIAVPTDVVTNTVVAKAKETPELLQPTNILVFLNAVDTTEEWTDDYYNAVCQDFWNEGSKYGKIVRLVVPRAPPKPKKKKIYVMPGELSQNDIGAEAIRERERADNPPPPPPPPGHGRVFIEFTNTDEARAALSNIAGRKYDGRMLLSSFVKAIPQ